MESHPIIKVMFVCHGNICRSPMAEFIFKNMVRKIGREHEFFINSSATSLEEIGNDIYPQAKRALTAYNIPFERRQAVRFTQKDYEYYDYILVMDSNNTRNIMRIIGADSAKKVHKLLSFAGSSGDIADPWYSGDFSATYSDIVKGLNGFLNSI